MNICCENVCFKMIKGDKVMLTEKQERMLNEVIKYINANKIAPTVRELCDLTGLKSTSTVHGYLNRLEREGYIKKHPTFPRTLIVLKGIKEVAPMISIPVEDLRKIKDLLNSLPEVSMPGEDLEKLKESVNSLVV